MKPAPALKTPTMCIRVRPGVSNTICGRIFEKSECVFEDGDHAVAFYMTSKTLRVCDECAAQHIQKRDGAL